MGSLFAATASFLDARAHGGRWLLRIEDVDVPRAVPGAAESILRTLERFGFDWDGPVVYQSTRTRHYREAYQQLRAQGVTFECSCSRNQLAEEGRYPGHCRNGARIPRGPTATRLRVEANPVQFTDRVQGMFRQDVAAAVGDFIVRRRDGLFPYVLAVIVDDAEQGINHVVRGGDLLDDTPRQIYLQEVLGLERPRYAHVPVLTDAEGHKLAKSRASAPLGHGAPVPELIKVFRWLGLEPTRELALASVSEAWAWAIRRWDLQPLRLRLKASIDA